MPTYMTPKHQNELRAKGYHVVLVSDIYAMEKKAQELKALGCKVFQCESATRVKGYHDYYILAK